MKKFNIMIKIIYSKVCNFLLNKRIRSFSEFMSDGGTHFFIGLIVILSTIVWWIFTVNSSNVQVHNISFGMTFKPVNIEKPDTVSSLSITFILDSKQLSDSTAGEYSSEISVKYHTSGSAEKRDTAEFRLYSLPYLDDLYVNQDSIVCRSKSREIKVDSTETRYETYFEPHKFETFVMTEDLPDTTKFVKVVAAKNAFVPVKNEWIEGTQCLNFYSNKLGLIGDSPYYNYYVNFGFLPTVMDTSHSRGYYTICFQFGDLTQKNGYYFNAQKNIIFNYIYPEPDVINNGFLFYYTKEKLEAVANNHGIVIQAEDLDKKNKNNRQSIIYSVLVGTGLAFFLDILVQLIRELRNFNRRNASIIKETEQDEDKKA